MRILGGTIFVAVGMKGDTPHRTRILQGFPRF